MLVAFVKENLLIYHQKMFMRGFIQVCEIAFIEFHSMESEIQKAFAYK